MQADLRVSTKLPNAKVSSAEWEIEAPYISGITPLPNFGTAHFGSDNTSIADTCSATIGGVAKPFGKYNLSAPNNFFNITMIDKSGKNKVTVTEPSTDGTSFTATFQKAGP